MEIGLSLGSNLGDRLAALTEAGRRIAALPGIRILAASQVYETDPVGAQPEYAPLKYLNAVLVVGLAGDLDRFAADLRAIETALGRVRSADRNAPRTMDIDVLYAGDVERADGSLDLPHPRWAQRRFVLQPLADVRPGLRLPGSARAVAEALAALPAGETVRRFCDRWMPTDRHA
jgi:2-amino-4-hydroxy-6-hydroxymethyldihydropteridine diphosphokinase